MSIIDDSFEQRSEMWFQQRLGNPGCSGMSNIITPQGVLSKSREGYLYAMAAEKLSGRSDEKFQSQHMINGTEREDAARALFELIYGVEVKQVGIVWKDEFRLFHCSPDGLPGDAILEMKNPLGKTMIKCILDNSLPSEYYVQCQGSLYVCERDLLYFMVAHEGIEPMVLEIRRDEKFIASLAKALDDFVVDLAQIVEKLRI